MARPKCSTISGRSCEKSQALRVRQQAHCRHRLRELGQRHRGVIQVNWMGRAKWCSGRTSSSPPHSLTINDREVHIAFQFPAFYEGSCCCFVLTRLQPYTSRPPRVWRNATSTLHGNSQHPFVYRNEPVIDVGTKPAKLKVSVTS